MVGYTKNENPDKQLSEVWHGLAGILSGMTTRFITQPLDVLKIRFQLQLEPLKPSKTNYYWGMTHGISRILREESYRALWKGHVPAQLLSGVYGLVQFTTFESLTKIVSTHDNQMIISGPSSSESKKTVLYFICGAMSGAVATVASLPFDTLRTRLVGQGEPKVYNGLFDAVYKMARVEGISSLYKGLVPALFQIMPHAGVQFASFHLLTTLSKQYLHLSSEKNILKSETKREIKIPFWHNLLCGSAAGLIAKLVVYPLDLTKKRLQIQGFEDARYKFGKVNKYNGFFHCLKSVVSEEGFLGLYKGISPSLIKAVLTSGLMFGLYEEIVNRFQNYKNGDKKSR